MGYRINIRKRKNGTVKWRLIREEWADNKRKDHHVPASEYLSLNLSPEMSIEDAKTRVRQLNAEDNEDRRHRMQANRIRKQQRQQEALKNNSLLPTRWLREFEGEFIAKQFCIEEDEYRLKKVLSQWTYAKKLIIKLNLNAKRMADEKLRVYRYFSENACSLDYARKVLRLLNLWADFNALKTNRVVNKIPPMPPSERNRLVNAYDDSDKNKKESVAITPEMLEKARPNLEPAQYRWLFLSVWLGLRPKEIDMLNDRKVGVSGTFDHMSIGGDKITVLSVYQPKLTSLTGDRRYKLIPLIFTEQKRCMDIAFDEDFKRPLTKTVQRWIHPDATLYGGRKGFTDLMLSRGQRFEDISAWLGHASVDMTWRHYKERKRVNFVPPSTPQALSNHELTWEELKAREAGHKAEEVRKATEKAVQQVLEELGILPKKESA